MRLSPISVMFAMLTIFAVWAIVLWIKLPHDDIRENLTMDEAQSLVTFRICTPTYIPPGIDPSPQIIYHADVAKVPEETDIRLRYKSIGDQELVFEVYQVYTEEEGMKAEFFESRVQGAEVSLLYWMFPSIPLSEEKLNVAREQAQTEWNFSQTGQTVWWLYEIVDPIKYRSTMTQWINNHVEYRVLSYLPAEEIKNITLSIIKCSDRY